MLTYYWINLDKACDRRSFMEKQFNKNGIKNKRVSAYSPIDLEHILMDKPPYNCGYPECIENGCKNCPIEYAVVCSHLKAIEEGYKSGEDYFIVCEDDIGFPFEIDFEKMVNGVPKEIDIIQMMVITEGHTDYFYNNFYKNKVYFIRYKPITPSAGFYLVSRKGAKRLLDLYLNNDKYNFQNCNFLKLADVLIYQSVNTIVATMPLVIPNINFNSQIHIEHEATILNPAHYKIIEVIKDNKGENPFIKKWYYPLEEVENLFKS
jgi:GR25 family glycosyltransferase involved in LPS biosynthesis